MSIWPHFKTSLDWTELQLICNLECGQFGVPSLQVDLGLGLGPGLVSVQGCSQTWVLSIQNQGI